MRKRRVRRPKDRKIMGVAFDIALYRFLERMTKEDGFSYPSRLCEKAGMRHRNSASLNRSILEKFLIKNGYMRRVFE